MQITEQMIIELVNTMTTAYTLISITLVSIIFIIGYIFTKDIVRIVSNYKRKAKLKEAEKDLFRAIERHHEKEAFAEMWKCKNKDIDKKVKKDKKIIKKTRK